MVPGAPDISIVIVSRDTRELLAACLRSIWGAAGPLAVETIVVDSDSRDGTVPMLRASFPEVAVVQPHANLGYARGNNLGIRHARGRAILILNPDTELT